MEVKAKPVLKNVLTYVSREVLFLITGFLPVISEFKLIEFAND